MATLQLPIEAFQLGQQHGRLQRVQPPADAYAKAYFPTLEEVDANKKAVTEGWDTVVGANVE